MHCLSRLCRLSRAPGAVCRLSVIPLPRPLGHLACCFGHRTSARSCLALECTCSASLGGPPLAPPAPCSCATAPPLAARACARTPTRGPMLTVARGAPVPRHLPSVVAAWAAASAPVAALGRHRRRPPRRPPPWSSPRVRVLPCPAWRLPWMPPPSVAASPSIPTLLLPPSAWALQPRGAFSPGRGTIVLLGALGLTSTPSHAAPPSSRGSAVGASPTRSWLCTTPLWMSVSFPCCRRALAPWRLPRLATLRPRHPLPASCG